MHPFGYGIGYWSNDLTTAWATTQATNAASMAARVASEAALQKTRIDRMVLAMAAMWSLLQEKTGLTEQDLEARVRAIDLEDGRLDGKIARPPASCSACGRALSPRHLACFYCGGEINRGNAIEAAR